MIRSLSCNEHKKVDTPIKLRRCQSGGSHHGQGGRRTVPSSGTWSRRLPFCYRKSTQIPWWDRWIFHTVAASLFFPENWIKDISTCILEHDLWMSQTRVVYISSHTIWFLFVENSSWCNRKCHQNLSSRAYLYNGIWHFLVS